MSAGRFLTTHVGSLPRQDDLIALMFAREEGLPLDPVAVEARVVAAVEGVVACQAAAGIDVINDGERSEPSYATYIKDRLNGFGGTGNSYVFADVENFPGVKARIAGDAGRKHRKTPAGNAPITVKDMTAVERDVATLTTAIDRHDGRQAFLSAATPGVTAPTRSPPTSKPSAIVSPGMRKPKRRMPPRWPSTTPGSKPPARPAIAGSATSSPATPATGAAAARRSRQTDGARSSVTPGTLACRPCSTASATGARARPPNDSCACR
ncbi:hypothetical protein OKW76_07805 [Sphingomonas sp. S1-29]|uniref:hypothetical protein n=1 Tax=Sphingomonas sp. S1-29 TaxID=2991074 RepID=UPI00223EC537|nr:hypothetical protein [Sphingomonas sp. S1-29]UZK70912.1 hypothetical protein OKW76_07805 [Sphingomonas sp. S1-29]